MCGPPTPGRPPRTTAKAAHSSPPPARPLYERYGFELESSLTRHVRPADAGPAPAHDGDVRPLIEAYPATVMRLDDRISGAHRHDPLRWAFGDAPRYAWIGTNAGASLPTEGGSHAGTPGYCLGRGGRGLGPTGPDR